MRESETIRAPSLLFSRALAASFALAGCLQATEKEPGFLQSLVLGPGEVPTGFVLAEMENQNGEDAGMLLFGLNDTNPGPIDPRVIRPEDVAGFEGGWAAVYVKPLDWTGPATLASMAFRFSDNAAMEGWLAAEGQCAGGTVGGVFKGEGWVAVVWGFTDFEDDGDDPYPDPFTQAYLADAGTRLHAKVGGEPRCSPVPEAWNDP